MLHWLRRHPSLHLLWARRGGLEVLLHLDGALARLVAELLLELVHVDLLGHVGARGELRGVAGNEVSWGCLPELALLLGVPARVVMMPPLFFELS